MGCSMKAGVPSVFRVTKAFAMKNSAHSRKSEPRRMLMVYGMLACGIAWGLVELFALQRSRYNAWRERRHFTASR